MNARTALATPPPLRAGERLDAAEFLRRSEAANGKTRAELREGAVVMAATVRARDHGHPHAILAAWLVTYEGATPGVTTADNSTTILDGDNIFQPDVFLMVASGGQARVNDAGYLVGAPELVVEIAASTADDDANAKFRAYERAGVREYLLWRSLDGEIDWFVLRDGQFVKLTTDAAGVVRSETFPGLWLDVPAALARNVARILAALRLGLATPAHAAFLARLADRPA